MDNERRNLNKLEFNYETASAWLHISERKLHQLVENKKITHVKIGREVRFRQIDLEEFTGQNIHRAHQDRCVRPLRTENQLRLGHPPG